MDEIDRELASALSIEPSPEFRARVRARIASGPAPRSWYLQWRVVGVAVAALAVMALIVDRTNLTSNARKAGAPAIERTRLPSTAVAASPVSIPGPRTFATAIHHQAPVNAPEVIVAASEARGLRQLAAIVEEGRIHFVFADERAWDVVDEPVKDIVVTPIAIAPLEATAISESAENSGGDEQ